METLTPSESTRKINLEDLSKEDLIKRCERLLQLAQKAKQAKDLVQNEYDQLQKHNQQITEKSLVSNEIFEKLTQQKLEHVTTIESLKSQTVQLENRLKECESSRDSLDSENVSFKRQNRRLTDENDQLIQDLENLEKQMEECKKLGLEQQNQLLALEKNRQDSEGDSNANELQKMLTISLDEVKKLQLENGDLKSVVDALKNQLCNKDEQLLNLNEELNRQELNNVKNCEELENIIAKLKDKLKLYHGKLVKFAGNIKAIKQDKLDVLEIFKNYTKQVEAWKLNLNIASDKLCKQIEMMTNENMEYCVEIQILKENNAKFLATYKTDDEKSKELSQLENLQFENKKLNDEIIELKNVLEVLQLEKESIRSEYGENVQKYQMELEDFHCQQKWETEAMQNRIHENEAICIEYRKVISQMEADIEKNTRELDELKNKNSRIEEALQQARETERQTAEKTSKEILKLVQENSDLLEEIKQLKEKPKMDEKECQSDDVNELERNAEIVMLRELKNALEIQKLEKENELQNVTENMQRQIDENELIISQMKEDISKKQREVEELKNNNARIQEALVLAKETECQIVERTNKEISKLVEDNSFLLEENRELKEKPTMLEKECQNEKDAESVKLCEALDELNSTVQALKLEKESLEKELKKNLEKHEKELEEQKKDTEEMLNKITESERNCEEYRKLISQLEEDVREKKQEFENLKLESDKALEHVQETERQIADTTSQEILKLVQENSILQEENRQLVEKPNREEKRCQTENFNDLENVAACLKRENSELLSEMNQMNQALKERGETISKLQSHCEEIMKKLQIYQSQANKNGDLISQKEETIKQLENEIHSLQNKECQLSNESDLMLQKDLEISKLKTEIDRLNSNLDNSYAESETMSTSTISRTEEVNRLKDLEGSWEERYGKLRTLALKLKGKVRDLSANLVKEQNEKNELQQTLTANLKLVTNLQSQIDGLQDELEAGKIQQQGESEKKMIENEGIITKLRNEIETLKQEKINTEAWKKQISGKVQTFRKELEANKILKKEYEAKIAKLTADLETKAQALKAESDGHQQTRHSLEHSNSERIKTSVLNLEMQDYERSVKELSQKLERKQDEINTLKSQIESQKLATNAIKEQNKLLEERSLEVKGEADSSRIEIANYKKQIMEMEDVLTQRENKIQSLTELLEAIKLEKEELSTELSEVITEHQKLNTALKTEKEQLRTQVFGLQQTLRDVQDALKLREDELKIIQNDYEGYKVRAQSVLRQSQSRDVGLEEKMFEELSTVKEKCELLMSELNESKNTIETLNKEYQNLTQQKQELANKFETVSGENEDFKLLYEQLTNKHQRTIIEHNETVRSLKINTETLAQCYRQQLSEQEVRHNREIIELQSKIEKAPSPVENQYPPITTMPREEGEGSENTETSSKSIPLVPLERLLGNDLDQEMTYVKKLLGEEESKVIHLTALLADTEQDLAKHVQMNKLLKEEIRRQQRSVEREEHAKNLEYLKNIVFKFVTLHSGDERSRLVPVLNTILKFSPEETQKLNLVARGDPGIRGWANYLPLWSVPSKP